MAAIAFDQHDAWIIWSIPANDKGTDLRGLIATADAINHAIPTREQLEFSIDRGLRSGLVEIVDTRFRIAPSHHRQLMRAKEVSRVWLKQLDGISAYLTSKEWEFTGDMGYHLAIEEYEAAVEDYLATF